MSYYDGKNITVESPNHYGHDVRYLGTNEHDDDLLRCYDCHPPLWLKVWRWITS